jgi:DNA-binding GntR family transcriptional regulator
MVSRQIGRKARGAASAAKPNGSPTITETAYWALKRAIVQGRFPEGAFLSEADVMQAYGIGRTPFREACNRLHHEELLEAVPRRGYMVRKMSFRQVRDFFELRLLVESTVAELAAVRATPDQIVQLEKLASPPLVAEGRDQQMEELTDANRRFHLYLASMTTNEELSKLMSQTLERSTRISYIELSSGRFHQPDLERFHRPIVEAVRARDAAAARQAMVADITNAQMSTLGHGFWHNRNGASAVTALSGNPAGE